MPPTWLHHRHDRHNTTIHRHTSVGFRDGLTDHDMPETSSPADLNRQTHRRFSNRPISTVLAPPLTKCIYCLQERGRRSYTKAEHVLPQSFGTFEQNITLHDVVCDDCNHYFGTNLEIHLARDTYEGELRFRHGVKDADEFKPSASGRQSRLALRLSEGPFAGCLVTRRYSQQKCVFQRS
jgi:hypothetical protein